MLGFLVVGVRADVADVRIGQADNLAGIAGVGENFLVAGEAGIENDFAAAPRLGASGSSLKNAPVFQSEYGGAYGYLRQWALQRPDLTQTECGRTPSPRRTCD
jgi:hypothetical protein